MLGVCRNWFCFLVLISHPVICDFGFVYATCGCLENGVKKNYFLLLSFFVHVVYWVFVKIGDFQV